MTFSSFNKLNGAEAEKLFFSCCGSPGWVKLMMEHFPFTDEKKLAEVSGRIWYKECNAEEWLAAFTQHPKIGDVENHEKKSDAAQHLALEEQASVNSASSQIKQDLTAANTAYEIKFGFIFIVCATGKSAAEMLRLLRDRLDNDPEEELEIAMGEQHKITILRLKKLIEGNWETVRNSHVTTHVLDTSLGKPGENLTIRMKKRKNNKWSSVAQGVTNKDGRISDLIPPGVNLEPGNYNMIIETGAYFSENKINGFYPEVNIQFTVADESHYHVPLLINPFGYSTYRGS